MFCFLGVDILFYKVVCQLKRPYKTIQIVFMESKPPILPHQLIQLLPTIYNFVYSVGILILIKKLFKPTSGPVIFVMVVGIIIYITDNIIIELVVPNEGVN